MRTHISKHLIEIQKYPHMCLNCNKGFAKVESLNAHYKYHHGIDRGWSFFSIFHLLCCVQKSISILLFVFFFLLWIGFLIIIQMNQMVPKTEINSHWLISSRCAVICAMMADFRHSKVPKSIIQNLMELLAIWCAVKRNLSKQKQLTIIFNGISTQKYTSKLTIPMCFWESRKLRIVRSKLRKKIKKRNF